MFNTIIVLLACAVTAFLVKLIFWLTIKQSSTKYFINSFFKFYTKYLLHDSTNNYTKRFKKVSNIANVIFWLSIIVLAILVYINVDSLFPMDNVKQTTEENL